jgi:ParB-like chromosome segregation protein Spo0J
MTPGILSPLRIALIASLAWLSVAATPLFAQSFTELPPLTAEPNVLLAAAAKAAALTARSKELGSDAAATLSALRDKAPTDEAKTAVDLALIEAYIRAHDWPRLLPISERLAKAYPDSGSAFHAWMRALVGADMLTQADAAVEARLANRPKDQDAIRAKVNVAARRGDYETAELTARRLVDESNPTIGDYNDAAWLALFRGKDLDRAIDDARRATPDENRADPGILHTLASLYAESGKSVEARQALLKSIDRRVADEPRSVDWFVLGRIAENFGIPDAALSAYKRVEKEEVSGLSTWELTQRRIKGLVAN